MSTPPQPPVPPAMPPPPQDENLPPVPPNEGDNSDSNEPEESHKGDLISPELARLLESVPKEKRAEVFINLLEQFEIDESTSMSMARMTHFSGPFPHPDILRGMDEVVPGAAREVIQMGLDQGKHRRDSEHKVIRSQIFQSFLGQIFGFVLAILFGVGAWDLIKTGHDVGGTVLGGIDIVGLVSVFVLGQRTQKKDLDQKKDE